MKSHGKSKKRSLPEIMVKESMVKKAEKKALRVAKKLKADTFVWHKKIEKDVCNGASLDEYSLKSARRKQKEKDAEAEKVKKGKEERSVEKARHEEDRVLLDRERAQAEFQDLEKKEKEFVFKQSKIRTRKRLRRGQAKPIDILFLYKEFLDGSSDDIELTDEPYKVFEGLNVEDMEELYNEIKMYLDWGREKSIEYWEALSVLCDNEVTKARVRAAEDEMLLIPKEKGLHSAVEAYVSKLLDGKTYTGLVQLQLDIESQMRSGTAKVVEYWEDVLKHLDIYKAKAYLHEIHSEMLKRHPPKQLSED